MENESFTAKLRRLATGCTSLCFLASAYSGTPAMPGSLPEGRVCISYLGNAGWQIEDGHHVVLVDPYISQFRESRAASPLDPDAPDEIMVPDQKGIDSHIHRADYILVTHGHVDHMLDPPYIATKTGANIIGSETVTNIARARNVPEEQLITVKGGEDYQFDGFSLRVVPSLHSPLWGKRYGNTVWAGEAPRDLKGPLHESAYVEGRSLDYLLRIGGHRIFITGGMNFIEREVTGLKPDVAIIGAGESRKESYKYAERIMRALDDPPLVMPTHWDSWGTESWEKALRNVREFAAEIETASPGTKVVIPEYFKPFMVGPGGRYEGACTLPSEFAATR